MKKRSAMQFTALCTAAMLAAGAGAQPRVEADFADRWVDSDAVLTLRLDAQTQARLSDVRVFVGRTDVSALVRSPAPGTLELSGAQLPLPAGESELVVYAVGAEQWEELARLALKVRDRGGFESSEFTPRAELQMKGRSLERHNGSGSPRGTYADIVGQGGVAWKATRAGWQFAAQANLSAVSFRGESLRFFELAERSPKVDLADYRVEAAYGEHRVELGHVSYGSHPLLLNSMASRGLVLRTRLGQRADLSLNSMNGTAVVGYDNLSGLDDAEHRINAVTLGVEMLPARPGGLRAELTMLDASVQSRSNFNRGEIPDAEQSRGVGVRVLARSASGRLRLDASLARSRFVNPFDPLLAQGGASQAVLPATRDARSLELQYDLLRQSGALSAKHALDVGLTLRHERADPLYKSLGTSLDSDRERNRLTLQAGLAGAQLQLQLGRSDDNLARIATLLRTTTDERTAALNLPLPVWFGDGVPASRWPMLAWTWQTVHQRAANAPLTADSGFAASHLPDQFNRTQQINFGWTLARGSLGYTLAHSWQDNRQPGRERADFANLSHQLSWAWGVSDALRVNLGLNRSRNHSYETSLTRHTLGGTVGADWQVNERWSLAGSLSANHADDSERRAESDSLSAQLQATRNFKLPWLGGVQPGQAFVRLARQGDRSQDNVFTQATDQRSWWIDVGVSFSLF